MINEQFDGIERRQHYCPVHHIKCQQWDDTEKGMKQKVPIWVFVIFISLISGAFSWLNLESSKRSDINGAVLREHIKETQKIWDKQNRTLNKLLHSHTEVSLNQKTILKKLNLTFQNIPSYKNGDEKAFE